MPPGVADQTAYSFVYGKEEAKEREDLVFDHGAIPDGVRDLDGLVQYRLKQLKGVSRGDVNIVENVASQFGSTPARRLDIELKSGSAAIRTLCLLAIPSERVYVQLTYTAPPSVRDAAGRLDHVARSAGAADGKVGSTTPGFDRRSVGMATIEVPSNLRPPSDYAFELPDNATTMEMSVWRPGDPGFPKPLEVLASEDAAVAERVSAVKPEPIQSQGGEAHFVRYTLAKKRFGGVKEFAVWRARIELGRGAIASVSARSAEPSNDRVDAAFLAFVQSVREE